MNGIHDVALQHAIDQLTMNESRLEKVCDVTYTCAQASLIHYLQLRIYTAVSQEAFRRRRGVPPRQVIACYAYHYPKSKSDGDIYGKNMWWANVPTVSLIRGLKDEPDICKRLGLSTLSYVLDEFVKKVGVSMEFVYMGGEQGNVLYLTLPELSTDGCWPTGESETSKSPILVTNEPISPK